MITQESIDNIQQTANAQLEVVIGTVVKLSKSGSNYKGLSPFTEERTPSFMVSPSKGIFKCFSSGIGGGVFKFFMEKEKMDFPEAVEHVAAIIGLEVEREDDGLSETERQERKNERKTALSLIKMAAKMYASELKKLDVTEAASIELSKNRELTDEDIIQWQLGYAPTFSKLARTHFLGMGQLDLARDYDLVKDKCDTMHGRIIFPLHDNNGEVIGLSGRLLPDGDTTIKAPKYINPAGTKLYNKDSYLYGLTYAKDAICKDGFVYLVEGYFDVIAMHRINLNNTVSPCGTALTSSQINILKRYCSKAVLILDGDKAGEKASVNNCKLLLTAGFHVMTVVMPEGEDPDSFIRKGENAKELIESGTIDFIEHYAKAIYERADEDLHNQQLAINEIVELLDCVQTDFLKEAYTDSVANSIGVKKGFLKTSKLTKSKVPQAALKLKDDSLPKEANRKDLKRYGFYQKYVANNDFETGIYFRKNTTKQDGSSDFVKVSNCTLNSLYHKIDEDNNIRILEVCEAKRGPRIVEMSSDAFASRALFKKLLVRAGNYKLWADDYQFERIVSKLMDQNEEATELNYLGWQKDEKFFAWSNFAFYGGSLHKFNDAGMVKIEKEVFYTPAASQMRFKARGNNSYQFLKRLSFKEAIIDFSKWANLMNGAYPDNAKTAIGFVFLTLFRDIVFEVNNNCPMIWAYGMPDSGKSTYMNSIFNLFYQNYTFCVTTQATNTAFNERFGQFANCPAGFNEVNEKKLPPERLESFKQAYDGESREKKREGSTNDIHFQEIRSTVALVGQYVITSDGNSLTTRSFLEEFKVMRDANKRPQEQVEAFKELRDHERQGLTSLICEVLNHRDAVEDKFEETFRGKIDQVNEFFEAKKFDPSERIRSNYCTILSLYDILCNHIKLPWKTDEYFNFCVERIERDTENLSQNDQLADFWTTFENLFYSGVIKPNSHFKIKDGYKQSTISVKPADRSPQLDVPVPKTGVMLVRMKLVHQLYFNHNRSDDKLSERNLLDYCKQKNYYLGYVSSEHFSIDQGAGNISATKTSCYAFDLEKLGMVGISENVYNPINTLSSSPN